MYELLTLANHDKITHVIGQLLLTSREFQAPLLIKSDTANLWPRDRAGRSKAHGRTHPCKPRLSETMRKIVYTKTDEAP
ncbi:MAG: hypothetical protein WD070_05440, partial [Pirellulaceae bacterium]